MKKLILLLLFAFLLIAPASAQNQTCIYFFYGDGCAHCARVEPVINKLELQDGDLEVHRFEIYNGRSNLILLNQFFDSYNLSNKDRGIPAIFIGENYLVGDKPIIENLNSVIVENRGSECPKINGQNATGTSGLSSPLEKLGSLSLLAVVGQH